LYHRREGGLALSTIFTCLYLNKYLMQVPKATPLHDFSAQSESYAASHLLSQLHKYSQARELKRRILVSKMIQKVTLNSKSSRSKNTTDFTHRYFGGRGAYNAHLGASWPDAVLFRSSLSTIYSCKFQYVAFAPNLLALFATDRSPSHSPFLAQFVKCLRIMKYIPVFNLEPTAWTC
jgi:hypothetical protein